MNSDACYYSNKIRENLLQIEKNSLSPYAQLSSNSKGRPHGPSDEDCEFRLCYQRDHDRIIHSKPFRRLKGKTQVFLFPIGDHYRTRLSHTLEVSQISRTIARALRLNEDLTEAIALGHDLGHTPFGHLGERILMKLRKDSFHHAEQSARIAKELNLTFEVCEGIQKHSKGKGPILDDNLDRYASTLEGQIVRIADIIAYLNHDIDDALRGGFLGDQQIPTYISDVIGTDVKARFTHMVSDIITHTMQKMSNNFKDSKVRIYMSDPMMIAINDLRKFLFEKVYESEVVLNDLQKIDNVLSSIFEFLIKNPDKLLKITGKTQADDSIENIVYDYISGMTDNFALRCYKALFLPKQWAEDDELFDLFK